MKNRLGEYQCKNTLIENQKSIQRQKKPPLGLMPKRIHQENRYNEICAAMLRYFDVNKPIPVEWIDEYNELLEILK